MATISSLSAAQSAAQSGLRQFRLQQAQRNADQAEQTARSLKAQARDAQQTANQAQENARSIAVQADQAQVDVGQARLGLALTRTVGQMQTQLSSVATQAAEKLKSPQAAAPTPSPVLPVINAQGQKTGTVINTTA